MSDWSSGYVADIGYTHGYYAELDPQQLKLAFLNAGLTFPDFGTACELGFGQGMSANIHAAASVTRWFGTDFNPSQAANAQELAKASGAAAELFDDSFADFVRRDDLPDFDFIGLHGIWSWINDENRAFIVDFIRRKLKVGGVVYISYNTLPGWSAFVPIRHLMTEHAEIIGSEGRGIVSRINDAIGFCEKLIETKPIFFQAYPQVAERIARLKTQNRNYLAHEYFNRDWHPMHFSKMADALIPAKMSYACSAHYIDHIDLANLTKEQFAFLADIPDPMFKETVRDFMVNRQFRKDYWIKGPRQLNAVDRLEELRKVRVMLLVDPLDATFKTTGSVGEVTMSDAVSGPLLGLLAHHKPLTLGEIEIELKSSDVKMDLILEACLILSANRQIAVVQDDKVIEKAKATSGKLNATLLQKARSSDHISVLASPVTGGGVSVGRFQQLFLLAINEGKRDAAELALYAWKILAEQGQRILKDGSTLESDEENISELRKAADLFLTKELSVLEALQIM